MSLKNFHEEIAADWIARRNGGGFTDVEEQELADWLAADQRHASAFQAMESTWATLGTPRRTGQVAHVKTALGKTAQRKRSFAVAAAGIAAAALVMVVLSLNSRWSGVFSRGDSVTVRPDIRTLPDGSIVELNSGAEIVLAYSEKERGVRLLRGEALFEVTKDPLRPFVVTAGVVAVRAVGTAFTVRHDDGHINILVTDGTVSVDREDSPDVVEDTATTSGPESKGLASEKVVPSSLGPTSMARRRQPLYVEYGRQVAVPIASGELPPPLVKEVSADELAAALAWRDKRIEFNDALLPDVITLFNRQNKLQLQIEESALNKRSITGVFWSDDPEGLVRLLESGFGIKAQRVGDVISLKHR